jgi:hypothetical protein
MAKKKTTKKKTTVRKAAKGKPAKAKPNKASKSAKSGRPAKKPKLKVKPKKPKAKAKPAPAPSPAVAAAPQGLGMAPVAAAASVDQVVIECVAAAAGKSPSQIVTHNTLRANGVNTANKLALVGPCLNSQLTLNPEFGPGEITMDETVDTLISDTRNRKV